MVDCNCACLGMASAARVPVKRYNMLVPDVFPVVEPSFDRPLGITIERKIKKLAEYLEKNEHRAPKVSRRLQRRLYAELRSGGFGYARLAVETYQYLLTHNRPEKSALLANELVVRTVVKRRRLLFGLVGPKHFVHFKEPQLGSAVGLLLTHDSPRLRKLGVDLLIDFIKCQQTSDYVPQLEAFVPLLCANALPHAGSAAAARGGPGARSSSAGSAGGSPVAGSAAGASAGSRGRSPRSGRRDRAAAKAAAALEEEEAWSALRAACLRALLEHLRFCARLSYVSYHLHTITFSVLECVDASGVGAPQGRYLSPRAELESGGGTDLQHAFDRVQSISRGSISHVVGASPPDLAALLVFEELAHMTRDAAEGKKVLEFVVRFLDGRGRWLGAPVTEISIAVMQQACEEEHQRYLLFSTLLRHVAAAEQLTPAERAAVLRLAVAEGGQLEPGLAAPALLLALRELPAVIASFGLGGGGGLDDVPPMPQQQLFATPAGPAALGAADAAADLEAGTNGSGPPAVAQEIELPRLAIRPGQAAGGGSGVLNLQPLVLAAVSQLAHRVQDSSQLVEAVSSTVIKLRGPAPISTAALQCCVAAAQAVQDAPPKMPRSTSAARTFPSLLLQELAGIMVHWDAQQRLLAHAILLQLLPAAPDGLREQQASILLSALWYEAAQPSNRPAAFVAADRTLAALLGAAPASALLQAAKMLGGLQLDVLEAGAGLASGEAKAAAALASAEGGGRLTALSPAQACAVLCVCRSAQQQLGVHLGQPGLEQLAAPGCEGVLPRLAVGQPDGEAAGAADLEDGEPRQQQQQQADFWQAPAASQEFSTEEQQRAAAFLASWRQGGSASERQAALAAALAAVPLFKQQQGAPPDVRFQPMPQSALLPRFMRGVDGGLYANGSHSSSLGSSKRAARLRSVYKHMRQSSLMDTDRIALATISQESVLEEGPPPALPLLGLLPGVPGGEGGAETVQAAPKSVDDVLAEVDAALAAAEQAMARGRSPSPPAWLPAGAGHYSGLGGGSSSSVASGEPGLAAAPPGRAADFPARSAAVAAGFA